MTINPQRFGQKYVGKVANPQDILIFSKASRVRGRSEGKIDESEKLRPEELNQQNIEALVAESNLKMEILPVNDLDIALHNFVSKDDKLAFHACIQHNLDETRTKLARESESAKFEEDDLIVKVGECLEERVKERATHPKESFTFSAQSEDFRSKSTAGTGNAVSFSDDEDATQLSGLKSTARGRKGAAATRGSSHDATQSVKTSTKGRGRGRGRGRGTGTSSMKQMTLDASLGFRRSQRSASVAASASVQNIASDEENVDSGSSDEEELHEVQEVDDSSEDDGRVRGRGRKRAATKGTKGTGRGSTQPSKRGKKAESSSLQRMLMGKDDDDEDDDDIPTRFNKSQPKVTRNYGALRR